MVIVIANIAWQFLWDIHCSFAVVLHDIVDDDIATATNGNAVVELAVGCQAHAQAKVHIVFEDVMCDVAIGSVMHVDTAAPEGSGLCVTDVVMCHAIIPT